MNKWHTAEAARRATAWSWSVAVLVALIVGVLAAPWLRGHVLRGAVVVSTTNPDPQFGIEPGWTLTNLNPEQLTTTLAGVQKLGVTWVRFDVDWALVQPNGPGSYDWSAYDRVVKAIRTDNLQALGIIDYSPVWAQGAERNGTQVPPAQDASYAAFAAAVAARYAPQGLHNWEIWNEPNWQSFWEPAPNAAAYTALLKSAYLAIHGVDPSATVVAAGLSGTGTSGKDVSALTFLNEMYTAGAKGFFDAVAMHPYTFPLLATDASAGSWHELYALHNTMSTHGDGAKKIWITEYGAPTDGPGTEAVQAGAQKTFDVDHVSESAQAAIVTSAVKAYETLPFAGPFFWYNYEDTPAQPHASVEASYGLVRSNGTPKPAYAAYQKAIAAAR